MSDLISRADAIAYIERVINSGLGRNKSLDYIHKYISALPSAEAVSREDYHNLLTATNDIDRALREYQAKDENTSAEAVQGWRIGKPIEQGKYMVTIDSFGYKHIDLFYYGKPMMPNRKVRGNCWYRSDDEWGDVLYDDKEILAWMPLPKPYKGGAE